MTISSRIQSLLLSIGVFGALVGTGFLLMADSACKDYTTYGGGTYDVVTTCNGQRTGRVTVAVGSDAGPTVTVVSGDIKIDSVQVVNGCGHNFVTFVLPFDGQTDGGQVTCEADTAHLSGTPTNCSGACTLQLTSVP